MPRDNLAGSSSRCPAARDALLSRCTLTTRRSHRTTDPHALKIPAPKGWNLHLRRTSLLHFTLSQDTARGLTPNLILMDTMIPTLDGVGVLGCLKRDSQTRDIPVIVLTGLSEKNHARKKRGATAYFVKSASLLRTMVLLCFKLSRAYNSSHK
jgi:CheY-like chemotaxis protein